MSVYRSLRKEATVGTVGFTLAEFRVNQTVRDILERGSDDYTSNLFGLRDSPDLPICRQLAVKSVTSIHPIAFFHLFFLIFLCL